TTSMRPGPQETAPGPEASAGPGTGSQTDQFPVQERWNRPLSGPRAKMSTRPGSQDEISGSAVMLPPRFSKLHPLPPQLQCPTVLPATRATTSRRPLPQETAPGPEVRLVPA